MADSNNGHPQTIIFLTPTRRNVSIVLPCQGSPESDVDVVELEVKSADLEQIIDDVFNSSLKSHVTSELNLARFIRNLGGRLQERCAVLLDELEAYRETIK